MTHSNTPRLAILVTLVVLVAGCQSPRAVTALNNTRDDLLVRLDGREWSVGADQSITLVEDDATASKVIVLAPSTCAVLTEGDLPAGPSSVVIHEDVGTPPRYSLSIRREDAGHVAASEPNVGPCSN